MKKVMKQDAVTTASISKRDVDVSKRHKYNDFYVDLRTFSPEM